MADLTDKIASKQADQGIIHIRSHHTVSKTSERLVNALQAKGMTLFTRIDHAAGAQSVGQSLPPTELVVFGNPKVGTRLMQCSPTTAIDLPQKALIWRDKAGQVWLSYNDPQYLAKRHHIEGCGEVLAKIEQALSQFAQAATQP
ncbi:DUF302 domain-containing protein [Acaryochloris sp. IP29b_bin.137]|uniref:DUF302 domain-containing protein n=1 Tax=Acaryochloris sp. IP29b_bin.137 TaxID=2969217 RepID=UPI00344E5AED